MADTTIGKLVAKLSSDITQFKADMTAAGYASQGFANQMTAAGQKFSEAGVRLNATNKLVVEFNGMLDVRRAEEYAAAVAKIGTAAQLTAADQAKVNAVMNDALDHYRRLGQEGPAHLVALEQATRQAANTTNVMGTAVDDLTRRVVAGFGIEKLIEFGMHAIETGAEIGRMAEAMDVSVETAQRFKYAAEISGESVEKLGKSLNILNKTLLEDTPQTENILKALGLTLEDLRTQNSEERFKTVVKAIGNLDDPMLQAEAASKLLGKSLNETLILIRSGALDLADGIDVMTERQVKDLQTAEEWWVRFKTNRVAEVGELISAFDSWGNAARYAANLAMGALGTGMKIPEPKVPAPAGPAAPTTNLTPPIDTHFAADVKAAEDAIRNLSDADRAELDAAKKLGEEKFKQVATNLQLDETEQKLYASTEKAIVKTDERAKAIANLKNEYLGLDENQSREQAALLELVNAGNLDVDTKTRMEDAIQKLLAAHVALKPKLMEFYTANLDLTQQAKEQAAALANINDLLADQSGILEGLTAEQLQEITAALAVTQDIHEIATAYGVTEQQVRAVQKAIKDAQTEQDKAAKASAELAKGNADLMAKAAALWDDYAQHVSKANKDTYGAAQAATDKWYAQQLAAIQKVKGDTEELDDALAALDEAYYARKKQDEDDEVRRQQANAREVEDLWTRYYNLRDQMSGHTTAVALRNNAQWLADEKAKILEAGKLQGKQLQDALDALDKIAKAQEDAIKDAKPAAWMNAGAQAISAFGQGLQSGDVGSAVGGAAKVISGQLIAGMDASLKQKAGIAIGQSIAEAVGGNNLGEQIGSLIGMGIGLAFTGGSPLGAAIGSAIGGSIGGIIDRMHFGHQISNAVLDVQREMGGTISNALATQIATTAHNLQTMENDLSDATARHYAELLNMQAIIAEQGGLNSQNLSHWTTQAERLFEVIHRGGQVGAAATQELSQLMQQFADQATKTGGLWDAAFKKLIADTKAQGVDVQAITDLTKQQTDKLAAGMVGMTAAVGEQAKKYTDLQQAVTDAQTALDDLVKSGASQDEIAAATDKVTQAQADLAGATVTTQDEFDRLSRISLASFATLVANGTDVATAMNQVGPGIDNLAAAAKAFGLTGNEAFDQLSRWRQLTTDNAALFQSIGSLNDVMTTLANLGTLDAATFADLQAQGESTFKQLTDAGLSQNEALMQMKPFLENIIKLNKEQGFAIDDTTQSLIDQATQQGILADQEESTNDILKEGFSAFLQALGVDIPAAWKKTTDAAKQSAKDSTDALKKTGQAGEDAATTTQNAWNNVRITVPVQYDVPAVPNGPGGSYAPGTEHTTETSAAYEGFFKTPTTVRVGDDPFNEGEFVLHKRTLEQLVAAASAAGNQGGADLAAAVASLPAPIAVAPDVLAGAGPPPVLSTLGSVPTSTRGGTVIVTLDRRFLAQCVAPELEGEVRRLGFGK